MDPSLKGVLSLSQTHVYYRSGDPLGYLAAWLTLVPIGILLGYATRFFIDVRDLETLFMGGGQVANELFNYLLKKLIAQNRPGIWGPGYGMPSSHAQFMGFFAGYFIARLIHYYEPKRSPPRTSSVFGQILAISFIASLVCWSRWYLLYHTAAQVIVGAAIGLPVGIVYAYFIILLRSTGILSQMAKTRLAVAAHINDINMAFPPCSQIARCEYNRCASNYLLPVQKLNTTTFSSIDDDYASRDNNLPKQSLLKSYNENFNKKQN